MAAHSNMLAFEIPWTEEPGGLQFMEPKSQTQLNTHAPPYSVSRNTPSLACNLIYTFGIYGILAHSH